LEKEIINGKVPFSRNDEGRHGSTMSLPGL